MRGRRLIVLWSVPRSRSTAFFRMMLERGDVRAVHEPFSSRAEHGSVGIDGVVAHTEPEIIDALRGLAERHRVFVKETTDEAYPAVLGDARLLAEEVASVFLIRHPAETIPSYYAVNPAVRRDQIGFGHLAALYDRVGALTGAAPPVLDAADLVAAPEATVAAFCDAVGLPYLPAALTWAAEDRQEWRATRRWHRDVSATTGFSAAGPRHDVRLDDAPGLREYLEYHLPYYERLRRHRIQPAAEGVPTDAEPGP